MCLFCIYAERHEQKDVGYEPETRTLSPDDNWKRMGDIRKHFFDSGFSAVGRNPELQVYTNFETRVGAKWVNCIAFNL